MDVRVEMDQRSRVRLARRLSDSSQLAELLLIDAAQLLLTHVACMVHGVRHVEFSLTQKTCACTQRDLVTVRQRAICI